MCPISDIWFGAEWGWILLIFSFKSLMMGWVACLYIVSLQSMSLTIFWIWTWGLTCSLTIISFWFIPCIINSLLLSTLPLLHQSFYVSYPHLKPPLHYISPFLCDEQVVISWNESIRKFNEKWGFFVFLGTMIISIFTCQFFVR